MKRSTRSSATNTQSLALGVLVASAVLVASCSGKTDAPTISPAGELYRLALDLDGDGIAEPVVVSVVPDKEPPMSTVTVEVLGEKYSTDFYSVDGDLPDLSAIRIDRDRLGSQLLMETAGPASCTYQILAIAKRKLVSLLDFQSGADCKAPQPRGNGTVEISTWRGFWWQKDILRLSQDGTSLQKEAATTYDVWVAGAAKKPIELSGAECPERVVEPGTFVRVDTYDVAKKQYLVKTSEGGCGWLGEDVLSSLSDAVGELPWAG